MGSFTASFLVFKKLALAGVRSETVLFWTMALSAGAILARSASAGLSLSIGWGSFALLCLAAAVCCVGNVAQLEAIASAPNPGYPLSVVSSSAVLTALLSGFLYGGSVSLSKALGMGLCLAGVALLSR